MNFNQQLKQALKRSKHLMDDAALSRMQHFVTGQLHPDGGFRGRDGRPDLYYTWFGLQCMRAFDLDIPSAKVRSFLAAFKKSVDLDFIHQACLMQNSMIIQPHWLSRMWIAVSHYPGLKNRLQEPTIYELFLVCLALLEMRMPLRWYKRFIRSIEIRQAEDGGYSDQGEMRSGTTTVTAAAVILLHHVRKDVDEKTIDWLKARQHPQGGFKANPQAPAPDLLSTATALLALSVLGITLEQSQIAACWEFVETVWCENGGFSGHVLDEVADVEYTFYGLMCMGLLEEQFRVSSP